MGGVILVAGASGLVGNAFLHRALSDRRASRVVALVRRSTGISHPKLVEWRCATEDLLSGLRDERVDAVVCCLGTTMRNVGGDRTRFIHVDRDLVLGLARWTKQHGTPVFSVVSAIGADARSRVFYNRVKGEMESGLRRIGIARTFIFQPSILTGPRREVRIGERIGIVLVSALAPILRGPLSAYRPMHCDMLAAALLESTAASDLPDGVHVLRYDRIRALSEERSMLTA